MSGTRLAGKVVVITGASSGIGEAIARRFASEGATLVLAARSVDKLSALEGELVAEGGSATSMRCDVGQDDDVAELARFVLEGHPRVDVLVNNAGTYLARRFVDYTMDDWQTIINVNLFGTVRVTQAFLGGMQANRSGSVINVASTAGKYGSLYQSTYNASKHGVVGLTRCLALEMAASGVRVNAICPGLVDAPMTTDNLGDYGEILGLSKDDMTERMLQKVPIGRLLTSDEVAHLAVYLAADESLGMTGVAITLAGGMLLI
jgi:NAD(P)-dependent dehydrogenase (short-subunit alcohol dehydrogenase family)